MIYFVLGIVLIGTILLMESEREKNKLSYERYLFESKKIDNDLKVIFLTDLHNKEFGKDNYKLIQKIKEEKPDLILIGGDIIITKANVIDFTVLKNLLKELSKIAKVIYCNGNHELRIYRDVYKNSYGLKKEEFENILKENNVIFLNDSHLDIGNIRISGLNIPSEYYKDFTNIKLQDDLIVKHLGESDKNKCNLLLAHNPLYFDAYAKWGADLTLAGHFHGGVLRLGKQGVLTSQWQLFHKWCCGEFKINDSKMIVSRGLGGHTINVRLNNLPEISIINLKKITQ